MEKTELQKKNLKLALILASVAVMFAIGFFARMSLLGK
jgi:hypothetical protein